MRWIAAGLLLANVLLLIAQLSFLAPSERGGKSIDPVGPLAQDIPELRLLHELDNSALRSAFRNPEQTPEPFALPEQGQDREGGSAQRLCTLVGPFEDPGNADTLVERLSALEVAAAAREMDVADGTGYWVHLPPLETRRRAIDRLRELQAENVDSFVIPRGELENGISLGMFSRRELAQRRLEDMRGRGFDVQLRAIPRTSREVWVVLPPGDETQIAVDGWEDLYPDSEELERRQNFCPPVASG